MSRENVEIVLEAFERFEAGDIPGLAKLFDPDITTTAAEGWPEQGPWIGRTAVVAQYERLVADWTEMRVLLTEIVADVGDWVVVQFSWQVRGAQSGIETRFDPGVSDRLLVFDMRAVLLLMSSKTTRTSAPLLAALPSASRASAH
jgi:ketosteroid isomerase-like protein